jgi:cellulose synthase/poly-beta-1,6-N-acetylglucosamine synthase-like glycosyltransferase
MYSHAAGKVIVQEISKSMTEDTEGLFRARSRGYRIRYYSGHDAQFLTMVPEDMRGLHKQWRRWATGNGQVMSIYGLGGGVPRIAIVNGYSWLQLLLPIPVTIRYGIISYALWSFLAGLLFGIIGAIRFKRTIMVLIGLFLPFMTVLWALHAFQGLYLAWRLSKTGKAQHTWDSPKRTQVLEVHSAT